MGVLELRELRRLRLRLYLLGGFRLGYLLRDLPIRVFSEQMFFSGYSLCVGLFREEVSRLPCVLHGDGLYAIL